MNHDTDALQTEALLSANKVDFDQLAKVDELDLITNFFEAVDEWAVFSRSILSKRQGRPSQYPPNMPHAHEAILVADQIKNILTETALSDKIGTSGEFFVRLEELELLFPLLLPPESRNVLATFNAIVDEVSRKYDLPNLALAIGGSIGIGGYHLRKATGMDKTGITDFDLILLEDIPTPEAARVEIIDNVARALRDDPWTKEAGLGLCAHYNGGRIVYRNAGSERELLLALHGLLCESEPEQSPLLRQIETYVAPSVPEYMNRRNRIMLYTALRRLSLEDGDEWKKVVHIIVKGMKRRLVKPRYISPWDEFTGEESEDELIQWVRDAHLDNTNGLSEQEVVLLRKVIKLGNHLKRFLLLRLLLSTGV